jgi:hypothetical protein
VDTGSPSRTCATKGLLEHVPIKRDRDIDSFPGCALASAISFWTPFAGTPLLLGHSRQPVFVRQTPRSSPSEATSHRSSASLFPIHAAIAFDGLMKDV